MNGNIAYQLDTWPDENDKINFASWVELNNIPGCMILPYYDPGYDGDISIPSIQLIGYLPDETKILLLLTWA